MNPLTPSGAPKEDAIVESIRRFMEAREWIVEKLHGSMYARGWPDLYAWHLKYGARWIEVKRPGEGRLENSQIKRFGRWHKAGLGVWVMTKPEDYGYLFKEPNWWYWLDPQYRRVYDKDVRVK